MDMNTKITKEDIKLLLQNIEEVKQSLIYIATVHPVGKVLGVDKEQLQHLTELKLYLYYAWELFHFGDANSIVPEKDRNLFAMFKAEAYDKEGNRMPKNDFLVTKIPETIEYVKTDNVLIDCYGALQVKLLSFMLTIQEQIINERIGNSNLNDYTESEKLIIDALQQLSMGNDGDATYHPLYKAWRSLQQNPSQLKSIQDYGKYGMGFMIFLSYGTVTDIDDKQQLASLSYLFLSKAIADRPSDANLLKNRLILMISNHEAFEYTVSSVVNKGESILFFNFNPFKARDAMFKMEYADLSKDRRLLSIDMLSNTYHSINNYLRDGSFGRNETEGSIIATGNQHHKEVLEYLEQKVIANGDIDF